MGEVLAQDQTIYISARTNQQLCELPVIVLELESYQLTSRQKARCVRDAQLEDEYPCNMADIHMSKAGEDVLQQLMDAIWGYARPYSTGQGSHYHPKWRETQLVELATLIC